MKKRTRDKEAKVRRGDYSREGSLLVKFSFLKTAILVISLLAAFSMSAVTVASGSDGTYAKVRILGASQAAEVSTTSTSYGYWEAGTLSVATTSNVTVFYSAEGSLTDPNDIIRIRCTIGGYTANTDDIKFVDYSTVNVTQSAVFYYPNVPAGSYVIKIGNRSSLGQEIKLRNQTLVAVAYPTALSMVSHHAPDEKTTETTYGTTNVWQVGTLEVPWAASGLIFYSAEGNISAAGEVLHVRCVANTTEANIADIKLVDGSTMNVSRGAVFYVPSLTNYSYRINLSYRSSTSDGVTLRNQTLVAAAFPALVNNTPEEVSTASTTYDTINRWNAGTLSLDTTSDVAVYYAAEGNVAGLAVMHIRCTIGDTVASISDIKFVDSSTMNVTQSAVFYYSNVEPGSYPINISYRSSTGNAVTLRNQTLIAISQKAPPPVVPVPEFSPIGLLALVGIVSAVLAVATMKRRVKR
jgi:hypothetical protein